LKNHEKKQPPFCPLEQLHSKTASFLSIIPLIHENFSEIFEPNNIGSIVLDLDKAKAIDESEIAWEVGLDDTAFLQYTSGSTGKPKGVVISNRNLINNSETIIRAFGHDNDLVMVNWLPPYHDMGLIGNLLNPLYVGGKTVSMNPNTFLRSPFVWLKTITRYHGQTTGCPNFALDYCCEKISEEQKNELDLSSLKVLYCGSEPIKKLTFDRFVEGFSACGFKAKMFLPCYGLAESTLLVNGLSAMEVPEYISVSKEKLEIQNIAQEPFSDEEVLDFVSCGPNWMGNKTVVVDPKTNKVLDDDCVGEIWVSGHSVSKAYWNDEEESQKTFHAKIEGSNENYLRTGDLGFLRSNHLFVSGRIKDVIIIRGKNIYPHFVEDTVMHCHPALQIHACAAISVDKEGGEKLVIVQELKRTFLRNFDKEGIFSAIREAVAIEHEIEVACIVLIRTGSIAKTPSGKIQHFACKTQFLQNSLDVVESKDYYQQQELENTEINMEKDLTIEDFSAWFVNWIAKKQKMDPAAINIEHSVFETGIDSINLVELERDIIRFFSIQLTITDLFECKTISALSNLAFKLQVESKAMAEMENN
jgi:acyl-CoA synthetase (AMP-forming)/AMP-acid ligase II/acyl carrier protein